MDDKQIRGMRPEHLSGAIEGLAVCACGCGESFVPARVWHKFKNTEHRKRAWKMSRVSAVSFANITARLDELTARLAAIEKKIESK